MLLPRIQINIVVPIDTPQIWTWRRTHENDFIFEKSGEGEEWVNYPATEIRDAVLLVKTPEDLCRFLGKYGDPGINPSEYVGTRNYAVGNAKTRTFKEYAPPRTHRVFLGEFVELQAQLKRAMDDKVESWSFGGTVDLESMLETMVCELKFSHEELTGICTINNPVEACFGSLFLEKFLEGVEYVCCQECGKRFPRQTRHIRKYCGSKCGQKVALRRFRSRRSAALVTVKARLA
jgi:hypothetical protein